MTDPSPMKMTEDPRWNDLPAALDLALFEQLPNGRFHPVGRMPGWWRPAADLAASEDGIDLGEIFPLLELFFAECESAWEPSAGLCMESDIWTEHGERQNEEQ